MMLGPRLEDAGAFPLGRRDLSTREVIDSTASEHASSVAVEPVVLADHGEDSRSFFCRICPWWCDQYPGPNPDDDDPGWASMPWTPCPMVDATAQTGRDRLGGCPSWTLWPSRHCSGAELAQGSARIAIPIYAAVVFVPLVWRHRWPVRVFCMVLALCVLTPPILPQYHPAAGLLVAVAAVAASTSRRISLLTLAATALPFSFAVRYAGAVETDPASTEAQFLSAIGYVLLWWGLGPGYWAGRSRRRVQQLEDQHRSTSRLSQKSDFVVS